VTLSDIVPPVEQAINMFRHCQESCLSISRRQLAFRPSPSTILSTSDCPRGGPVVEATAALLGGVAALLGETESSDDESNFLRPAVFGSRATDTCLIPALAARPDGVGNPHRPCHRRAGGTQHTRHFGPPPGTLKLPRSSDMSGGANTSSSAYVCVPLPPDGASLEDTAELAPRSSGRSSCR